jgi:hypothetical protein
MELIKVQAKKTAYEDLVSGKTDELVLDLTENLAKRVSDNGNRTFNELMSDNTLLKKFDKLYVSRVFSSDNSTFFLNDMFIRDDKIVFKVENVIPSCDSCDEENETDICADTDCTKEPEEEKDAETIVNEHLEEEMSEATKDFEKEVVDILYEKGVEVSDMKKRVDETLDNFCKSSKVIKVNAPRVNVRPQGVLFGLNTKLPIENDVAFYVDIEKQKFYHTYDMSDDEFISQLTQFLKRMLLGNYVFIWRSKCAYKVVDGKRYLILYYTVRRYNPHTKTLL